MRAYIQIQTRSIIRKDIGGLMLFDDGTEQLPRYFLGSELALMGLGSCPDAICVFYDYDSADIDGGFLSLEMHAPSLTAILDVPAHILLRIGLEQAINLIHSITRARGINWYWTSSRYVVVIRIISGAG